MVRGRSAVIVATLAVAAACASGDGPSADPVAGGPASTVPGVEESTTAASTAAVLDTGDPGVPGTTPAAPEPDPVRPEGFTTTTVRITAADGEVCEVCMWLADDVEERGRGLMGVTDLGEPVGMAFVFAQPVEGAFYMFGTPTPLSIAWFAPDGTFVSATDMEPCATPIAADCERFRSGGTYQLAIEVFAGGLDELGIGPGSTAEVVVGSESPGCAASP